MEERTKHDEYLKYFRQQQELRTIIEHLYENGEFDANKKFIRTKDGEYDAADLGSYMYNYKRSRELVIDSEKHLRNIEKDRFETKLAIQNVIDSKNQTECNRELAEYYKKIGASKKDIIAITASNTEAVENIYELMQAIKDEKSLITQPVDETEADYEDDLDVVLQNIAKNAIKQKKIESLPIIKVSKLQAQNNTNENNSKKPPPSNGALPLLSDERHKDDDENIAIL
jgi:hypothetical protein